MTGLRTALCGRLGIELPIVQAPVGSAAGPELAAAAATAGALGMLALTWQKPEQARDAVRRVRRLTDRPFGVNLVLDFPVPRRTGTPRRGRRGRRRRRRPAAPPLRGPHTAARHDR